MPITVTHAKVSAIADDPTAAAAGEVLPSDWNANHEVVLDDTQINIQNGQTVTGLTRTAAGSGYTSFPSVLIAPPTAVGGTQAAASVSAMLAGNPTTVQTGGSGYSVNDVLTVVGGTPTAAAATYTVTSVSAGAVTGVTALNFGVYTTLPTNPVTVTGGTGTGCTLNLTYGVASGGLSVTSAGSGYVEQPAVTFSGGGGSAAAAYAVVGTFTTFKSLGSGTVSSVTNSGFVFRTPNTAAPAFVIREAVGADSFVMVNPQALYANVVALGATNANLGLYANGGGNVVIGTSGTSNVTQFRVSHTASAVNYVQATGAATGGGPTISAQGSDANVGLVLQSKGTLPLYLVTPGAIDVRIQPNNIRSLSVWSVASAVNYWSMTNAAAGSAPVLSAEGSDTNIQLQLQSKGTGLVRFVTGGGLQAYVSDTASAVNAIVFTGAPTTGQPSITAQGSDASIGLTFRTKGNFNHQFQNGSFQIGFEVNPVGSGANYLRAGSAVATAAPTLSAQGSDTNIDLQLAPKGTGRVRFGTHTATVDTAISGYIEILDAGGTVRRLAVIT